MLIGFPRIIHLSWGTMTMETPMSDMTWTRQCSDVHLPSSTQIDPCHLVRTRETSRLLLQSVQLPNARATDLERISFVDSWWTILNNIKHISWWIMWYVPAFCANGQRTNRLNRLQPGTSGIKKDKEQPFYDSLIPQFDDRLWLGATQQPDQPVTWRSCSLLKSLSNLVRSLDTSCSNFSSESRVSHPASGIHVKTYM